MFFFLLKIVSDPKTNALTHVFSIEKKVSDQKTENDSKTDLSF